jgi:peptidoglycan hydrolase CwlO-like protein
MLNSKKSPIIIILILACILMPVFATEPNEPNEPKTEIKFKINDSTQRWSIGSTPGRGPIKPTHVAELFIKEYGNVPGGGSYGNFDRLLQTPISKSMTSNQKEFLKTSSSYSTVSENLRDMPIGYLTIRLYAVSQEDAKKMALAFIELLNERARERIKLEEDIRHKIEQEIAQAKKELPEKQKQLKEIEKQYDAIKEATHRYASDADSWDLAKKNISEMERTLNELNIELAGIQERLKTIEKYRNQPDLRAETYAHLDQMYIENMVELSGLEARKKVTEKIHRLEEEFIKLFNERGNLSGEVDRLNETIKTRQMDIEQITNRLNKPTPEMQPPEVYQNTVTIYPV